MERVGRGQGRGGLRKTLTAMTVRPFCTALIANSICSMWPPFPNCTTGSVDAYPFIPSSSSESSPPPRRVIGLVPWAHSCRKPLRTAAQGAEGSDSSIDLNDRDTSGPVGLFKASSKCMCPHQPTMNVESKHVKLLLIRADPSPPLCLCLYCISLSGSSCRTQPNTASSLPRCAADLGGRRACTAVHPSSGWSGEENKRRQEEREAAHFRKKIPGLSIMSLSSSTHTIPLG